MNGSVVAYEWKCGSRKKAYQEASKASYSMIFNEDIDEYALNQKIREYTNGDTWKDYVIDILIDIVADFMSCHQTALMSCL